jgi:hypothetical protein
LFEEMSIDTLTPYSVGIKTQRFIEIDGQKFPVGNPNRAAYVNSERSRIDLINNVPEPFLSSVLGVWGDIATVSDDGN